MLQRIRNQVGTAGLVIAIVALVAALAGGAYAASGGLSGKQKKEVRKIAKHEAKKFAKRGKRGPQGKPGPAGPAGPTGAKGDAGAAGATGPAGPAGPQGLAGPGGSPGAAGPAGESVEAFPTAGNSGEPCEGTGGSVYEVGGEATEICNGEPGILHPGETLPKGATETGAWGFTIGSTKDGETTVLTQVLTPVSFTIPLPGNLLAAKVHFVPLGGEGECNGTAAAPKAPEGELCIYQASLTGATFSSVTQLTGFGTGTNRTGALLKFTELSDGAHGSGSWALTGS